MDLSLVADSSTRLLPSRLRGMGYRSSYVVRVNKDSGFYEKVQNKYNITSQIIAKSVIN